MILQFNNRGHAWLYGSDWDIPLVMGENTFKRTRQQQQPIQEAY